MQVLLVGIDAETKAVAEKSLSTRRHEQASAADGALGLEAVALLSPPLIVVQDPLPDMSAAAFCRRVRSNPAAANAVILVVIKHDTALPEVLEAGATDLYVSTLGPSALEIRLLIAERLVKEHERLRDREARFRRLFESGVTGVTIADLDGNFKEANDSFLKMLGYTREEMLAGKLNWSVITPLDEVVPNIEAREQLRATGFLPLRERLYVHKDGHHVAALVGAAVLEGTAEYISYVADISDRKQTEEALRASESKYRALFNSSPLPKWVYDVETLRFLAVNDTAIHQYGYSRDEFLRMTIDDICVREDGPQRFEADAAGARPLPLGACARRHRRKDGAIIDAEETVHPFLFGDRPSRLMVAQNVSERRLQEDARRVAEEALRRSEERFRQSQKMEAIGSLAGGVAHDFNNLLSVILSYSEMLARDLKPGDPMRLDLDEIKAAGNRAADLTRQLLAFSRQQILKPRVLNPNEVIAGLGKLLVRLIGEDVELAFIGDPAVGRVNADPGQLEQMLMNLVVNARDAMPTGGKLTIETSNVELDAGYAADHTAVAPGAYVMVAVTDTGCGMDEETRARIFEPFFTTKAKGKGTGLGLSTVFGIVRQSGGHISVYSEPGAGTAFRIYLPQADPASVVAKASSAPPESVTPRGAETVLLVEDEKHVRALAHAILRQYGYHVLEAHSGGDALVISEQHPATIHLLLTDVVMPRMSGRELAERIAVQRPATKVLFMSGYTDASIVHHGILDSDIDFIHKPITPDALARKVREVLDAPREQDRRGAASSEAASGTFGVTDASRRRTANRS